MAWTAPRTWTTAEMVTHTLMNEQVKANLDVLGTHAHNGAAGMGNDEITGIDHLTMGNTGASPSVAGRFQRNGANLHWHSSGLNLFLADQSAGTASLRTLGTGSTQAAAGNHTHSP